MIGSRVIGRKSDWVKSDRGQEWWEQEWYGQV